MRTPTILVINPGSTSTRITLFDGQTVVAQQESPCPPEQLARCQKTIDQIGFRADQVRAFLREARRAITDCDAVAARGGPLRPVAGGVYRVNSAMLADARSDEFIEHASKLACIIADQLCRGTAVPCFIVDPVSTDELADIARVSGLQELPRKGLTHALNLKRVARQFARSVGRPYESLNLITAHLGGGISIAVHQGGRMVDSVDANGEGPFSPERSGGLRVDDLARMVVEKTLSTDGTDDAERRKEEEEEETERREEQRGRKRNSLASIRNMLTREGGLMSHLGTTDCHDIEGRIQGGDAQARQVYEAMAYAVAKHISALAAVVRGRVDGVILTGGLAKSEMFTSWIRERVQFLAPVAVYPGEDEMAALREGVARALANEEAVKAYPTQ